MVIAVAQEKERTAARAALDARLQTLEDGFLALAEDDELAFAEVMEALRMPREEAGRSERLQAALERAARVPLRAADAGVSVLCSLAEAEPHASRSIVSDIGVASHLALAAIQSSLLNVTVNLRSIKDPAVAGRLQAQAEELRTAAEAAHADVVGRVDARLAPKSA
jgi:formiminotetrahydrofolate cyclodeaminase